MSHTPHELGQEFPEYAARIHDLKLDNSHFAKLADTYHEVNRAIHRAETRVDAVSHGHEEALRRQRMALKDEIYRMLTA